MIKTKGGDVNGVYNGSRALSRIYVGANMIFSKNLPIGYTEVEYIQSSNGGYIDLGWIPNGSYPFKIKFKLAQQITGWPDIFGTEGNKRYEIQFNQNKLSITFMRISSVSYTFDRYDSIFDVDFGFSEESKFIIKENGILKGTSSFTTSSSDASNKLVLFGNPINERWNSRIYYLSIRDKYELIPCISPSNKVGFYNKIDNSFIGGNGTLIAGPAV